MKNVYDIYATAFLNKVLLLLTFPFRQETFIKIKRASLLHKSFITFFAGQDFFFFLISENVCPSFFRVSAQTFFSHLEHDLIPTLHYQQTWVSTTFFLPPLSGTEFEP
jgi:hypothetical protein